VSQGAKTNRRGALADVEVDSTQPNAIQCQSATFGPIRPRSKALFQMMGVFAEYL